MTSAFRNSSIQSNAAQPGRSYSRQRTRERPTDVQFPLRGNKSVDLSNKPLHHVDSYTANQKTIVQNMFNKKNLNETLNYKNTFYLAERGVLANKEANTIYDHDKVYQENVVDADLKANYSAHIWKHDHIQETHKVRESFKRTSTHVNNLREEKQKQQKEEARKHSVEVRGLFKKVQNVVGVMVGTLSSQKETLENKDLLNQTSGIDAYNIQRVTVDQEATLNNRASIRALMGTKSFENQDKIRAEKEAEEKEAELERARELEIQKQEETKIGKYMDLQKLSKAWRIYDNEKLKGAIRNEIMKEVLREEERKNFDKIAANMRKSVPIPKTSQNSSPAKKSQKKLELPTAYSPGGQKKKKGSKKYKFSPQKVQKLPKESQEDYKTRFGFAVMTLPRQKALLDPVEQHKITSDFQQMIIRNAVEKNGRLVNEN